MIEADKTAANHEAIADHYHSEAVKARAKAGEHDQTAQIRRNPLGFCVSQRFGSDLRY